MHLLSTTNSFIKQNIRKLEANNIKKNMVKEIKQRILSVEWCRGKHSPRKIFLPRFERSDNVLIAYYDFARTSHERHDTTRDRVWPHFQHREENKERTEK